MHVIEDLKAHINLADTAGRYTTLHPAGQRRLKGLCPLHKESKPSFFVFTDTQRWHCFGCNKRGDVLDLVQAIEGWDFPTALQELARQSGFQLPTLDAKSQALLQQRQDNESVFTAAIAYFETLMHQPDSPGLTYALSRGWHSDSHQETAVPPLCGDTIRDARLGFYDGNREALRQALSEAGVNLASPPAVAVLRTPGPSLIYPFVQHHSIVYYAARLINPPSGKSKAWNPPNDLVGPKPLYFNHRYTPYAETVILVEGQGDAVTLGQWSMAAVATVGTAAVKGLRQRLEHHKTCYIGVEHNAAGEKHARELAGALNPDVQLVRWPEDDANAWLQAGAQQEDLENLLSTAPAWLDCLIEDAMQNPPPTTSQLQHIFQSLLQLDRFQLAQKEDALRHKLNLTVQAYQNMLRAARGSENPIEDDIETYCVSDGKLCHQVTFRDRGVHLSPLCNFDARIIRDILVDDGQEQQRRLVLSGSVAGGAALPEISIPADEFARMQWIIKYWGARAMVNVGSQMREHLRHALQQLSTDVVSVQEYAHLGWREIEGQTCYLTHAGAVGCKGVSVRLPQDLHAYELPVHPEHPPLPAAKASLGFWEVGDLGATIPLWAMMFLAPLTGFLHPSFTLWLYGTTGSMKSTLTALAMCHYGHFRYDAPATGWSSTAFALRRLMFLAKDAPLWIDDYTNQSTQHGQNALQSKADLLLREWGNRGVRSAGQKDGTLQTSHAPRGLVVTTAEILPQDVSIRARLYTVEMHPGMVQGGAGSALTHAQNVEAALYPSAMAGYLLWLAGQWKALRKPLRQKLADRLESARQTITQHPRSATNVAILGVGLEMGLRYIKSTEAITEEDFEGRLAAGWDILLSIGAVQDTKINREYDSVDLFFSALEHIFTQGTGFLRSLDHPESESFVYPQIRTGNSLLLGWYDPRHWHLLSKAVYQAVYQFYRASGILFPDSESGVKTKLSERGLTLFSQDNRHLHLVRVNGVRKWVLTVPAHGEIAAPDEKILAPARGVMMGDV